MDFQVPPKPGTQLKKGKAKSPASSLSSSRHSSVASVPVHSFVQKAENVFASSNLQSSQKVPENNHLASSQTSASDFTSMTQSLASSGGAKLTDLCPEDKARIGELMKRLAKEKEEKDKLRKELEDKELNYGKTIEHLEKEKEEVIKESQDLQSQFKYSIGLLKSFQELNNKSSIRVNNASNYSFNESLLKADKQFERSRSQSTKSHEKENTSYDNFPDHDSPSDNRLSGPFNARHLSESEISSFDRAKSALSNIERHEKNSSDINRIKDDLEELANNLKKVSFSPSKSVLSKSMLSEADFAQERKAPSPIKLVENYKTRDEGKKIFDNDGFPAVAKQPSPEKVQAKPPRGRANPLKGFSKVPPEFDAETSSDEDELAIAQKWLNLRKQKISQINQQIQQERDHPDEYEEEEEEAPRFQTQSSHSPPKRVQGYSPSPTKGASTASSQYQTYQSNQFPTHQYMPNQFQSYQSQSNQFQSNPYNRQTTTSQDLPSRSPNKFNKPGPYDSASRNDRLTPQRNEGTNRQLSTAEKLKSVPVDINTLKPDEMVELKKILEERLQIEMLKDKGEQLQRSAEKKLQKIEEILNSPENQKFRSQSNSKSPILKSTLEETQNLPNKPFFNATKPFEPLDTMMKTTTNPNAQSKMTLADSSIMKEFESLSSEFSTPMPYKTSQNFKVGNMGEEQRDVNSESQLQFEKLYEEKLKEFLKIRDRMIEANKLKGTKDINVEEILRSTLKGETLKQLATVEDTQRTERSNNLASPFSVPTTIARSDMPILHERDLMSSEFSKDRTSRMHSNLQTLDSKKSPTRKANQADFMKPTPLVPARQISFSTEQPVKIESKTNQFNNQENLDELIDLVDDFYEDNLFDIVEDIEKKENLVPNLKASEPTRDFKKGPNVLKSPVFREEANQKDRNIDDEFNNLFNSVKTMLNKDKDENKVNKKLLQKFERSEYILPTIPAVTEEEDTQRILEIREKEPRHFMAKGNEKFGKLYHSKNDSKTDSSYVETDQSVLFINKKVEELKKKNPKKTNAVSMRK